MNIQELISFHEEKIERLQDVIADKTETVRKHAAGRLARGEDLRCLAEDILRLERDIQVSVEVRAALLHVAQSGKEGE